VAAADVGRGHALLLESGEAGTRYLLGGQNLRWRDLHQLVSDLAGVTGPFEEVDVSLAMATASASEWWSRLTGSPAWVTEDETRTIGRYYWYDHSRVATLGYAPMPPRETVAIALSWLLASTHLPRWVREGLRPAPIVRRARPLIPRSLEEPEPSKPRRAKRAVS
jgi:dihydroflavonol-4-reductase